MKRFETWWKEGVIYQIYPRSFQDSNGDGIGDIPGIISRLDYLQWLGVNALWLSPIYQSPMFDFGYDISDYRAIDPVFGTLDDVDKLIQSSHEKGIRIIFDMVLNHTSSQHAWFKESCTSLDNPKRGFYIWHEGEKGRVPNNWYAAFGGKAWTFDGQTGQYYLHSFLSQQPDLNWRNPQVVSALFADIQYWLERGVDGFRLDVINLIIKDRGLTNNPTRLGATIRPYDMQRHLNDRNQPEAHIKLKEFRSLMDQYQERMLVGEIMAEKPGEPEVAAAYLGNGNDELNLAFDFSFTWIKWDARMWQQAAQRWYHSVPTEGWPCWVFSNHDVERSFSRFGNIQGRARIAALFLLTQKGTPFIYYGEEIGMRDKRVSRMQMQDPVGRKYWPFHPGRDGQRRPMQWGEKPGFSSGRSWLPMHPDKTQVNVALQKDDPSSLLSLYHNIISLRNHDDVLRLGGCDFIETGMDQVLAYIREYHGETRLIVLNFSNKPITVSTISLTKALENETLRVIFSTNGKTVLKDNGQERVELEGYQGIVCGGE